MLDWTTSIIDTSGYLGIVLAMFLENVFPPIPSELVMLFSGAAAATGDLNLFLVVIAAGVGSTIGLLPWYVAGWWYGQKRLQKFADKYGRLLTFSAKDIDKADEWFEEHGKKTVFVGRFIPAVRTLVAVPAAITKMDIRVFLLFAFLGSLVWDGAFAMLGYLAGENSQAIEKYVDVGTYITVGIVLIWYVYRVVTFKKST